MTAPSRGITVAQADNADNVGQYTCHDGVKTYVQVGGFVCGTLVDDDLDRLGSDGLWRLESRKVGVRAGPGDSGAAVFTGSVALGGLWGGDDYDPVQDFSTTMLYSHIFNITDLIGGAQNTVLVQTNPD